MNKKQIDSSVIENELKGASAFFPTSEQSDRPAAQTNCIPRKKVEDPTQEMSSSENPVASADGKPQKRVSFQKPVEEKQTREETKPANYQLPVVTDATTPSNHDTMVSRHHDTTVPSMVEVIRKAAKLVGKEAATHRFTPEEKQAIADIIYTYRRKGYDTSENEIARIAINWVVWDHLENGDTNILAQVLTALKE
jgi:hypothetical protein